MKWFGGVKHFPRSDLQEGVQNCCIKHQKHRETFTGFVRTATVPYEQAGERSMLCLELHAVCGLTDTGAILQQL
jgi:hypothetical protein